MNMRLWKHTNGYYYLIIKNKQKSLKTKDKRTAEKVFKRLQEEYLKGRLIQIEKGERRLLSDFIDEYREHRQGLSKSSLKGDRLALQHFMDYYGNRPLSMLTEKTLDKYKGHLKRLFSNITTANAYIRDLKTALKKARKWGYLTISLEDFKKDREDSGKQIFMTPPEVERLIEASQSDPVMKTVIPIMLYAGISRDEIMSPILFGDNLIQYRRKKTGAMVSIPIAPELRPYLLEITSGIHRLVPWKNARTLSRKFEQVAKLAGLKGISPHKVRHTFATTALMCGMDIATVSELLGHKDISTTMKFYAHILPGLKSKSMNKLTYRTQSAD